MFKLQCYLPTAVITSVQFMSHVYYILENSAPLPRELVFGIPFPVLRYFIAHGVVFISVCLMDTTVMWLSMLLYRQMADLS